MESKYLSTCEIFNKDYKYKILLMGYMKAKTKDCDIYDIYLYAHEKYYIIKISLKKDRKKIIVNWISFDDFILAKLHTHVIALYPQSNSHSFIKLSYFIPKKITYIDDIYLNILSDNTYILKTNEFEISKFGDNNKVVIYLEDCIYCERNDLVKKYFNEEKSKEIIENWKANDEYQYNYYINMKGGNL